MIFSIILQLFKKDWVLKSLLFVCLPLLIASFFVTNPLYRAVIAYLLFVVAFTAFDSDGFKLTEVRDDALSELRLTYRVIQNVFEVIILWGIYQYAGYGPVVGCVIAHWFCVCDKLFYILRREPEYKGLYTWLYWSVFGVLRIVRIQPTAAAFNIVAIIGFAGGLIASVYLR